MTNTLFFIIGKLMSILLQDVNIVIVWFIQIKKLQVLDIKRKD